jgi:hypothetical protein
MDSKLKERSGWLETEWRAFAAISAQAFTAIFSLRCMASMGLQKSSYSVPVKRLGFVFLVEECQLEELLKCSIPHTLHVCVSYVCSSICRWHIPHGFAPQFYWCLACMIGRNCTVIHQRLPYCVLPPPPLVMATPLSKLQ